MAAAECWREEEGAWMCGGGWPSGHALCAQHAQRQDNWYNTRQRYSSGTPTHLCHLQRVVADHAQLAAGEGGHKGARPGGDQDVARRHAAPPHVHGVGVHQLPPALDVLRGRQGRAGRGRAVQSERGTCMQAGGAVEGSTPAGRAQPGPAGHGTPASHVLRNSLFRHSRHSRHIGHIGHSSHSGHSRHSHPPPSSSAGSGTRR